MNGFLLSEPLIPADEIYQGGPPRDGIPSLDNPIFIHADDDTFLRASDKILGLSYKGLHRAYPIGLLNHHEIVNDMFNGNPVVVSFCPLCGTGMAFDADIDGQHLVFGVSGLLYNSDVLMYDRQTDSLWSQIQRRAVNGKFKGKTLVSIPLEHTTWGAWTKRFPKTQVLSHNTGHARDYKRTPYVGYSDSERIYFPVSYSDKRYHPKEVVVGVTVGDATKAYPFIELSKAGGSIRDTVNGQQLTVYFDAKARSARVEGKDGELFNSLTAYWFAWFAFHPDTDVFRAK
ncbi:MAG: DUF3179 domain-containing protein [Pseudomonadales bacterium]|nr:DUF3179 domain-containing protein [Pseudomonadales bacterium]